MDTDFHKTMFELHQNVNTKEQIVGWYASGAALTSMSVLVHDFYGQQCAQPIHLTVDTALTGGHMAISAYLSSAVTLAGRGVGSQFQQIATEIMPFEAEPIRDFVRGKQPAEAMATARLKSELDGLKGSLQSMDTMLEDVCAFVERVNRGEEPQPDRRIGRFLGEMVAKIPKHSGADFDKLFADNVQDLLMVAFLAQMAQTQLKLAEKLGA